MVNVSVCVSPLPNRTVARQLVRARRRSVCRQVEPQRDARLLRPVSTVTSLAAGSSTAAAAPSDQSHSQVTVSRRVVDDDELLLDRLARPEVVVLARERRPPCRRCRPAAAGCCGAAPCRRRSAPSRTRSNATSIRSQPPVDVVGAEARPLEVVPVDRSAPCGRGRRRSRASRSASYSHGEIAETPQVRKARQLSVEVARRTPRCRSSNRGEPTSVG